jgi:uncharacterized C2H2 Zn-finger protein
MDLIQIRVPELGKAWIRCPRCKAIEMRDYSFRGYCEDCAHSLIDNLSEATIANVWKAVDKLEVGHDG